MKGIPGTHGIDRHLISAKMLAVYNNWTGLVNWTGGLTLKIIFTLFNKTCSPVELCGNLSAFSLQTQSWNKIKKYHNYLNRTVEN